MSAADNMAAAESGLVTGLLTAAFAGVAIFAISHIGVAVAGKAFFPGAYETFGHGVTAAADALSEGVQQVASYLGGTAGVGAEQGIDSLAEIVAS